MNFIFARIYDIKAKLTATTILRIFYEFFTNFLSKIKNFYIIKNIFHNHYQTSRVLHVEGSSASIAEP